MKSNWSIFLILTVSLIAGCASPPFTTPDVIEDFQVAGQGGERTELQGDLRDSCWLIDPQKAGLDGQVESARRKLLIRSCTYAYYHDSVKAFKTRSDQATLGFASIAAVGAATNSHSDFVKSMVGLMGLSGATRVYVNPNVQMSVYMKSAIATQCMAEALGDLHTVIDGSPLRATRSQVYGNIDDVAAGLNMIRYHPEVYPYLFDASPRFGVQLVALTANPDQDAQNKKAAIAFLFDVERLTNQNMRLIRGYIEAVLSSQAFNVENAVKVIPVTQVPKKDAEANAQDLSDKAAEIATAAIEDDDTARAAYSTALSGMMNGMKAALKADGDIPYADIIRVNNDFSKCMAPISDVSL